VDYVQAKSVEELAQAIVSHFGDEIHSVDVYTAAYYAAEILRRIRGS